MPGMLVEIRNLSLTLSSTEILKDISLEFRPGEIHCLVGPNGGGKTSLLKCILGKVPYTGDIFISYEKEKKIGYVPQNLSFEKNLPITVEDFLAVIYQKMPCFLGISRKRKSLIEDILTKAGMYEKRKRLVGNLSGGERQRLLLSQAIYPKPELLILDEPFTGIDKLGEEYFKSVIKELKEEGVTIIWIHHNLKQVIEMADVVTCIRKEVQFTGKPDEMLDEQRILTLFA